MNNIELGFIIAIAQAYSEREHLTLAAVQSHAKAQGYAKAVRLADLLIMSERHDTSSADKFCMRCEASDMLFDAGLSSLNAWRPKR